MKENNLEKISQKRDGFEVKIDTKILEKYPLTEIGYVVAKFEVKEKDDFTEDLKSKLLAFLNSNNINEKNYSTHPQIDGWRKIFKTFGVSHKTNRCSVEALVRRIVSGSKMFNVSNVVDLYNCCSVLSIMPMGAYDLEKIDGDISIRFGKNEDQFDPLGSDIPVKVEDKHVVYADDKRVLGWLWNYRDSKHSCIDLNTKHAIFFLDSAFEMKHITMEDALHLVEEGLSKIGAEITSNGILNRQNPEMLISNKNPKKTVPGTETSLFEKLTGISSENSIKSNNSKPTSISSIPRIKIPYFHQPIENIATPSCAIHSAAIGDFKMLKTILDHDKSLLNAKDSSNSTLLMHAVVGDHENIINYLLTLLNLETDLKAKNAFGDTVFDLAERRNSTNAISILSSYKHLISSN